MSSTAPIHHDTPVPTRTDSGFWGSDVVAEVLRLLDIPYIALNPGASYRGLHDSIVNFEPGKGPEIILCTHEEIAVALANGYARATGEIMATGLHNVVGSCRNKKTGAQQVLQPAAPLPPPPAQQPTPEEAAQQQQVADEVLVVQVDEEAEAQVQAQKVKSVAQVPSGKKVPRKK